MDKEKLRISIFKSFITERMIYAANYMRIDTLKYQKKYDELSGEIFDREIPVMNDAVDLPEIDYNYDTLAELIIICFSLIEFNNLLNIEITTDTEKQNEFANKFFKLFGINSKYKDILVEYLKQLRFKNG